MRLRLPILAAALIVLTLGCGGREPGTVWQVSAISALMAGDYEGSVTCGELRKHGDFGLGTFDALDGEMVVEGGVVYRAGPEGVVTRVEDSTKTPFAAVTFFESDCSVTPAGKLDIPALESVLARMSSAKNVPCAVKVAGRFARVQIRTVPRQTEPYPRLAEAVKRQSVVDLKDIDGVLVAFRMPAWADGVNVPGLHLHFISADRTRGGHVLAFEAVEPTVDVDFCRTLVVNVPGTGGFRRVDLAPPSNADLDRVERPAAK